MRQFLRHNLPRPIAILLACFVLLGVSYSIANPIHEATDELRHYRFVRYIAVNKSLPVQGEEPCRSQSHHPPLIYALGALATFWIDGAHDICYTPPENPFWNYRYWEVGVDNKSQYLHGADEAFPWWGDALIAHIVRLINVLIGAGAVWLTWGTGRLLFPRRPILPLVAAAIVGFNPQFVYLAAAINNDVIAALSGTAILFATVKLLTSESRLSWRWGVTFGLLFGLALMSKFNLAAFALPIATATTWLAWRRNQWRGWLELVALAAVLTAVTAGWWFLRNYQLYGDLTGFRMVTELWGVRDPAESLPLVISELPYAWTTLWGRLGFGQIPLPDGIYLALRWFVGLALLGWLVPLFRRGRQATATGAGALTAAWLHVLLVAVLAALVWFNYMLVSPAGAMGRFFFPGLPALALLVTAGLNYWSDWLPGGTGRYAAGTVIAGFATLAVVVLLAYLRPAYAQPPGFAADAAIPNEIDAQFDYFANLRGYRIDQTAVQPGEKLHVELYWEVTGQTPGDYLLFVHLIDGNGLMVAQRDTHPGLGRFPSSRWQEGDRFIDSFDLFLPETAYTPNEATLSIGLWVQDAYRIGITGPDGASLGDALPLATIAIEPVPGDYPNRLAANFEGQLLLQGYQYDDVRLAAGDELTTTLYWQTLAEPAAAYELRLELWDENGDLRVRQHRPLLVDETGRSTNAAWQATYGLPLPADLAPGSYEVRLSVVDAASNELLHTVGDSGNWIDIYVYLARIRVD
ncbi:MAG: glycosyltransferase family 39 protein [Ardenticatenales bacterium]|nr:glycosyltransferase family 39 protein [Ardenticatenales bacterium]